MMTRSKNEPLSIFWFRRDLRIQDNAGLYHALKSKQKVLPLFIFDQNILEKLSDRSDRRVQFIFQTIMDLKAELESLGSTLLIEFGDPVAVWAQIIHKYSVREVYTNHDYEPYARKRDDQVNQLLVKNGILFESFKDQVIFEKLEITKDDGKPYTVFTPYKNKWLKEFNTFYGKSYPTEKYTSHFIKTAPLASPKIADIGFQKSSFLFPVKKVKSLILESYDKKRDYPALEATSHLGLHFRFGTVSIRKAVNIAKKINAVWLNELIWREFFMQILWNFPHVATEPFRPEYKNIKWRNNKSEFEAWKNGQTGYPMVDAGMRELNATGFMHNRARMITASFLTKHLLIDWRWGEKYFAEKLLDFDLSANNGNWQWAAGTGCDAAPYFRVFNPAEQLKKFDPKLSYVSKWIPELNTNEYPKPIVDHKLARIRAIETYSGALKKSK